MKKRYYTMCVVALAIALTTCSKSASVEEEGILTEGLGESEKVVVDATKMEKDLLDLINQYRAETGATKLQSSTSSYKYAKDHNVYMIGQNKLSHDNFDSRASKIASEINAVDIGENVARHYATAQSTLDGWLKSSSHKTTIEGDYTHTVLSVQLDKEGRPYFTQIFMKVK
ncbi:CAP domain-containing protein [Flagellimonas sp. 389]|uniref:CAP domain-containing protein n=1 Tax=Flagellimonas sp. 389 TaxID=2835862 RepID=UPI001BD2D9D2|nr:CAP domain-containing protein [Flagellimonas sp. 389]MBS9463310.1 CAP domain-containing protein [Flagellimonas sp. 389]